MMNRRIEPKPVFLFLAFFVFLFLACHLISAQQSQEQTGQSGQMNFLAIKIRAQVIVADRIAAGETLTSWAEENGGFFLFRSLDRITLRIRAEKVEEFRLFLSDAVEELITYEPSARDVREELTAAEAGIESREEVLNLVLGYLEETDVEGTLALEREIGTLVSEIELLKGRQRRLNNDATFAFFEVFLSSPQQSIPVALPSSFHWINTVDLYRFLNEVLSYAW